MGARSRYQEALSIFTRLIQANPSSAVRRLDAAAAQFYVGEMDILLGQHAAASRELAGALEIFRSLSQQDPSNLMLQWAVLGAEFRLAQANEDAGGIRNAIERVRFLDGLHTPPFLDRWITELRELAQTERAQ